ncbi:MAG: 3-deoxy-7-phosphoheptulonate synthase [Dehalococcoidales bacterium]|nr:3-deoxy-7-phosphoheptulonate synthase [Dehalococcoidales bacterium]
MEKTATIEQINDVIDEVISFGLKVDVSQGEIRTVIGIIGDERRISFADLALMPGVKEAIPVEKSYRFIGSDFNATSRRIVKVRDAQIGGSEPVIIAGPCAVESKEQIFRIAKEVQTAGAHILRGGIFKPRTSVYSFQGLGSKGESEARKALEWLRDAGHQYGMPVVTEVRGESHAELIAEYADILQIGSRNMYNQDLLSRVGKIGKPVLLKRHFGASIEDFLSYAEYIAAEGNRDIILCERGILPVSKGNSYARYILDLEAIPIIQRETYLPVIVDPSHAAGRNDLIFDMSCASIAAGANGLMIESHYNPRESFVDAKQAITPDALKDIITGVGEINKIATKYRQE